MFIDISKVQVPADLRDQVKPTTKPFWRLAVEQKTGLPFSAFHKAKSEQVPPLCVLFNKWKLAKKPVTNVRCDNAGENTKLESALHGR